MAANKNPQQQYEQFEKLNRVVTQHLNPPGKNRKRPHWVGTIITIVILAVVAYLTTDGFSSYGNNAENSWEQPTAQEITAAQTTLEALPVKKPETRKGYDRERQFGSGWADLDRDGCNTRNEILNRDMTNLVHRDVSPQGCLVDGGTLDDPYTGDIIEFDPNNRAKVQIEHVVALFDAWQKGAQHLTKEQRVELANDPDNLLAAYGPENQSKGHRDASEYLPPNESFQCSYVIAQITVKERYELWVTSAEKAAMSTVLKNCS
ncbi:HNH endonuclease family protein [Timonella sp. A28]|uniref:HNH endonuclease family protein n=1 Tax=Timonella sp. A28 TaxID=3442640 RepID=UPI003EBEE2D1